MPIGASSVLAAAQKVNALLPGGGFLINNMRPWLDVNDAMLLTSQRESAGDPNGLTLSAHYAAARLADRDAQAMVTALRIGTNATTRTIAAVEG